MFLNVPVPAYLCIWYDLVNHFHDTQNYYVSLIIDLEANTLIITTLKIKTNVFLGDNLSTVFPSIKDFLEEYKKEMKRCTLHQC